MQFMSSDVVEIFTALSKAQGEFRLVEANKTNPHFRSKYSDLGALISESREILAKYGLSVTQPITSTEDGKIMLTTILSHTSGQWIKSEFPIMVEKQTPQGFGSALTYFRRYAFSSITGVISGEEDDDGNAAESKKEEAKSLSYDEGCEVQRIFDEYPDLKARVMKTVGIDKSIGNIPPSFLPMIRKAYAIEISKETKDVS